VRRLALVACTAAACAGPAASSSGTATKAPDRPAPLAAPPAPAPVAAAPARGRSAGCGKPAAGTGSYVRRTITIRDVEREYFLWLPAAYDANRAYPIVFRWHGAGGNGTSGGLPIEDAAHGDAIVASPSGVRGRWDLRPDGVDVALFDALLNGLGAELCLDETRVFSYGFSMGGMMSNLLGCVRAGVVRAVAPVAGAPPRAECTGQVAAWIVHSPEDGAVDIARGRAARDAYLQRNGCDAAATAATAPAPCVRYDGCAAGFPVIWCETSGPHNPLGSFSAPGAWQFFSAL